MGPRHGLAVAARAGECDWGALVARIAAGETAALGELYDLAAPLVYGLALRILRDPAAAEEVTGDSFVQAWQQAATWDPLRGSVLRWLLVMTRSRAIDRLRGSRRDREVEPIGVAMQVASGSPGPEEDVAIGERRHLVHRALARLGPEQRQVIELAYFGGLSHREIATRLAQPLGTVKTRIRLGMTALRDSLALAAGEVL